MDVQPKCLCYGRTDLRCDAEHCDIAGPGEPGNPNSCRICWNRLGRNPVKPPPFIKRVWNYGNAVFHHVRRGMPIVSEEEAARRLSLCQSCDWYNAATDTCAKCGCGMHAKVTLAALRCPKEPPLWIEGEPVQDKGLLERLLAVLPFGKG